MFHYARLARGCGLEVWVSSGYCSKDRQFQSRRHDILNIFFYVYLCLSIVNMRYAEITRALACVTLLAVLSRCMCLCECECKWKDWSVTSADADDPPYTDHRVLQHIAQVKYASSRCLCVIFWHIIFLARKAHFGTVGIILACASSHTGSSTAPKYVHFPSSHPTPSDCPGILLAQTKKLWGYLPGWSLDISIF